MDSIFGPTQASSYWSSSAFVGYPNSAWDVYFNNGYVNGGFNKMNVGYARAVRGGR